MQEKSALVDEGYYWIKETPLNSWEPAQFGTGWRAGQWVVLGRAAPLDSVAEIGPSIELPGQPQGHTGP